ncbi:MAG: hypothetical protein ACR2K6_05385 [Solirubrobacterales bacterium]
MSREGDPSPADEEGVKAPAGILGNLPRTRPAVRSPRRGESGPSRRDSEAEAAPADRSDRAEPTTGERPAGSEIEQLAKAGLTLAGGVASIGLKAAGRAASTLRETIERS